MKIKRTLLTSFASAMSLLVLSTSVVYAEATKVPSAITTPDIIETKIGTLHFNDGYPTKDTAAKIRDELDYIHGVDAFMNSIQGVSLYALRKGLADAGIKDGEFMYTSRMLGSKSLLLTANADTVYYWGNVDLSQGPLIVETPPMVLGIFDDFWFRWVGDFGLAGPDKGQGGKYLLVGPEYEGKLPEGGYFVRHSRTNHVTVLFRAFLENNKPDASLTRVKDTFKIYPYKVGGHGHSVASYLEGKVPLTMKPQKRTTPKLIEASGLPMNTIPPNDFGHYEMLNALVQMEPASALDVELAGQFAAIGIEKGKKFSPDARMKKILEKSVAFANAAARSLGMGADPVNSWRYYGEDSAWWNMLFEGGYDFKNPPPAITKDGVKLSDDHNARRTESRTSFFYTATGNTPAMVMYLTGVGSQYLMAMEDKDGIQFDPTQTYKVTLPKDIPAARFWSITVYDVQTRSMVQTSQEFPRVGSQNYPSPAAKANADGSTTIYFGPKKPKGVSDGNWVQTDPKRSWFMMLRCYSPLQSFFDKTWRISEVELVKNK